MKLTSWLQSMALAAALTLVLIEAFVIYNLARTQEYEFRARQSVNEKSVKTSDSLHRLKREAKSRAVLYNNLVKKSMLVDGMVINRNEDGGIDGLCDSLLFSSLRLASLKTLEMHEEVSSAWDDIQKSRNEGQWWRHPRCKKKSLSRDMLMGVMISLKLDLPNSSILAKQLLNEIDTRWGSFSDGPFFVSYLSPGPAGLLRQLAQKNNIPFADWPWVLKQSFSSIEYDAVFLRPGYESHLAGLGLWLEDEFIHDDKDFNPRSLLGELERLWTGARPNDSTSIDQQRRLWIATVLTQENPGNLFFEFLFHRIKGDMDDSFRIRMLETLLDMPQFPIDRLPMDCDRYAEYIWQRRVEEFIPEKTECKATYSGVDFLWMAALLTQD